MDPFLGMSNLFQTKYFKEAIKENQLIIDDLDQDLNEYKSDII